MILRLFVSRSGVRGRFSLSTMVLLACSALVIRPSPACAQTSAERGGEPEFKASSFIYFSGRLRLRGAEGPRRDIEGIFLVDPETGAWRRLLDKGNAPRISNDGASLVYSNANRLWTCDAREAANPGIVADLNVAGVWSGDGKSLFASERLTADVDSKWGAWQISADGLTKSRLPISEYDIIADVSPDGEWITTVSDRNMPKALRNDPKVRRYQVYIMHPDGTKERNLSGDVTAVNPRFSPDSQRILYLVMRSDGRDLRTVKIDGTEDQSIISQTGPTNSIESGAWSPDGKRLAVRRFDWKVNNLGKWQITNPLDANFRIEIANVDGTPGRLLNLKNVEWIVQLSNLNWR